MRAPAAVAAPIWSPDDPDVQVLQQLHDTGLYQPPERDEDESWLLIHDLGLMLAPAAFEEFLVGLEVIDRDPELARVARSSF